MVSESERLLAEKAVELKTLKLREEIEISLAEKTSELEEFKLAFGNVEKVSGEREVERDALCKQVFVLEEQVTYNSVILLNCKNRKCKLGVFVAQDHSYSIFIKSDNVNLHGS